MKKIKKDRKEMLRNKKIYLAGIIITAIAAAVPLLLFQEHKKDTDSIEKFIKKYLAEYQPVCQEEVQMLSKELDSIIENQVPAGTPCLKTRRTKSSKPSAQSWKEPLTTSRSRRYGRSLTKS